MNDKTLKEFINIIDSLEELFSKDIFVGILGESAYQAGSDGVTIVDIGFFHEFGTYDKKGKVLSPKRSFLRGAFQDHQDSIAKSFENAMNYCLKGGEADIALGKLGESLVNISTSYLLSSGDGSFKELKKSTIKRRKHGGEKPLIDTGRLLSSITYRIS